MSTPATFAWTPSTARLVALCGFGAVPRGTAQIGQPQLTWPIKDPSDTLDYVIDISEAVAGNEGDSISTLDIAFSPNNAGDLVLESSSANGCLAVLWFSGGFAGTNYAVNVAIGTNSGRIINRTATLPVMALVPSFDPNTDITDQTGSPITDQNEQPITTS